MVHEEQTEIENEIANSEEVGRSLLGNQKGLNYGLNIENRIDDDKLSKILS